MLDFGFNDDARLQEWIQRDIAENMALIEFCDENEALETKPKSQNFLLPKFRIEGRTKKYKAQKPKTTALIPEAEVLELKEIMDTIELVSKQIEVEKKKIMALQVSNAQTQRDIYETNQKLNQIQTEAEKTRLDHLKELERARNVQEKVKKEEERSKKARETISKNKVSAAEELQNLAKEFSSLETLYADFKRKRSREKKNLEENIKIVKDENANLKEKLRVIEVEIAKNGF